MPEFPAAPVTPAELLEEWLPKTFAEADVPEAARAADVTLGVRLEGEGGGEWTLRVEDDALVVTPGSREEAAFTVVQSVEDWRGCLWEGRGGAIGQGAAGLFRPGAEPSAAGVALAGAPSPTALEQLRALDGVIRVVVTGGEGGDWAVAAKLGPGAIPEEATTTVSVSADDAAAMERGELNPLEAFMAGRILVTGDMALMMQVQAVLMQAAADAAAGTSG